MPKKSTIKRLPPEVRERIGVLLEQGRTLDEILDALAGLDVQISRSALHRYKQHIDKVGERIRRSRDMAEALVQRFGDEPESKVARMNIQFLHAAITDVISSAEATDEEGNPVPLDPRSAMELAKALDHLGKASKADADLISRIREEATKAANKQAASTVSEVGRKAGVPGTVIDQMMQAVLGGAV
ncbi:DUF3486 family protein [Desulfovibrio psychrotolerans]|uniref:DUF3486 family protein n=1 Tax=Desulfovibrio psychrotolerans TaxID=415242 RepID=A0A7J0BVE8_9BACT|nr:DUF3486 family protein [Desulfovibrio psychrotolerans]GFM37690.1 hypothetical protein DSM19430T_23740 [Desulfovibrio psychrotolerans]